MLIPVTVRIVRDRISRSLYKHAVRWVNRYLSWQSEIDLVRTSVLWYRHMEEYKSAQHKKTIRENRRKDPQYEKLHWEIYEIRDQAIRLGVIDGLSFTLSCRSWGDEKGYLPCTSPEDLKSTTQEKIKYYYFTPCSVFFYIADVREVTFNQLLQEMETTLPPYTLVFSDRIRKTEEIKEYNIRRYIQYNRCNMLSWTASSCLVVNSAMYFIRYHEPFCIYDIYLRDEEKAKQYPEWERNLYRSFIRHAYLKREMRYHSDSPYYDTWMLTNRRKNKLFFRHKVLSNDLRFLTEEEISRKEHPLAVHPEACNMKSRYIALVEKPLTGHPLSEALMQRMSVLKEKLENAHGAYDFMAHLYGVSGPFYVLFFKPYTNPVTGKSYHPGKSSYLIDMSRFYIALYNGMNPSEILVYFPLKTPPVYEYVHKLQKVMTVRIKRCVLEYKKRAGTNLFRINRYPLVPDDYIDMCNEIYSSTRAFYNRVTGHTERKTWNTIYELTNRYLVITCEDYFFHYFTHISNVHRILMKYGMKPDFKLFITHARKLFGSDLPQARKTFRCENGKQVYYYDDGIARFILYKHYHTDNLHLIRLDNF